MYYGYGLARTHIQRKKFISDTPSALPVALLPPTPS
jgi:hypothetical protein